MGKNRHDGGWGWGSGGTTSYKFVWDAASTSAQIPSGKTLTTVGGSFISSGCFYGDCYDNGSDGTPDGNYIRVPISAEDIITKNYFKLTFYFNPQTLSNYKYLFAYGVDSLNVHKVHVYADGSVYMRTTLNNTQYYDYISSTVGFVQTNTWYKMTYEYSSANQQIKVWVNDVLKLTKNSVTETLQGTPSYVYFSADEFANGGDILIDSVTIE